MKKLGSYAAFALIALCMLYFGLRCIMAGGLFIVFGLCFLAVIGIFWSDLKDEEGEA